MKIRSKLTVAAAALLALGIGSYAFTASSQERGVPMGPPMMGMGGMMGMGPGMMGLDRKAARDADAIHELLAEHDRIKRTVTNLADGIRTVTESDDPRIARLLREHVAAMGERVRTGDKLGLMETDNVHALYANKDKIRTSSESTANGIAVTQTSDDPKVVALLQDHARDVSTLVAGGMAALHTAMHGSATNESAHGMMHGMGGPMHEMMHGPMMRGRRGRE
jgi:Spy/CpxP family protein refolding chaperone